DPKPWKAMVAWLEEHGMAADLGDEKYLDQHYRQEHFYQVQTVLECFFLTKTANELFKEGQARGIPMAALYGPEDLVDDEHLAERGFFQTVQGEEGPIVYPGPPYVFSGFDLAPRTRPPRLGEHNAELAG